MKAVLRFGALAALGTALALGGVGAAAPPRQTSRQAPAPPLVQELEREARQGPSRMSPTRFSELPRIEDSRREVLADRKRDEAIEGFNRLLPKVKDGTSRKADLLYRLSELYWEKSKYLYRLEMERYLAAEKAHDAALARGERLAPPVQEHSGSERYRAETMRLYEALLADYPQYEARDEVLFSLGYNLHELGRRPEAVARYEELIRDFPQSAFVADTYIQLGNHYFDDNKLAGARENYEKARASSVPKIQAYAVYKLAWCDYNAGDYQDGLKKLHDVVDYAETRGEELGDLKTEALNDMTVFYVQLNQPDEALAYFKARAPQGRQTRLIAKTAYGLASEAGQFDSAIKMFRVLIDDAPMGPGAPEYQQAIVKAYEGLRQRNQVRAQMRRMVELYRPGAVWWEANAGNTPVLRNAFNVTEEAMRVMVTEYHQEAQKTRQVETYRLARDIYKQYVDAFATSAEPGFVSDSAFNMRFFYAEILWTLEEWEAAAAEYDAVVAFQIPDRDTARQVSEERYRKNASYAAVLAYDKLVKIERGQLARSDLKDGQKVDERKDKGDVENKRLVKRDAKERQEQPLTRFEERLVAACDTYNRLYPNNPDEIDLRYQAAVILYDRNHFMQAARRFGEIIDMFPEERRSRDAADLTMFVLESREEWLELNQLARRFLGNKKLARPGTDFAARVARVVEGSYYKWVDEVLYKKDKNPKRAAEEFLKFVAEFPKSDNADRALAYAMLIFQDASELDRGVEAGERVLEEYPGSNFELKVRYTLATFYEQLAEFQKAAGMYRAFVEAYDAAVKQLGSARASRGKRDKAAKPTPPEGRQDPRTAERQALVAEAGEWVADALFNAGVWWEGVGDSQRATGAYADYVARFRERKDVPQVAYTIALVHERDGRWADAARAFASFCERYARDSRTDAAQHLLARYREMLAWRQAGEERAASRAQAELVRAFKALPAQAREDTAVLDAYGHARFLELEPLWSRYTSIRLSRVATLRRDLAAKQREIQRVEREYADVLATGSGEWGIAALTRIGLAYADFARNLLDSPNPPGLDEAQLSLYREELQNLAMPLEDKATEALEKALEKAYELSLYDEWTLAAQEQLNRYRPGSYAEVRLVPLRGSEFFATADLVRDAGLPQVATEGAGTPPPSAPVPDAGPVPVSPEVQP